MAKSATHVARTKRWMYFIVTLYEKLSLQYGLSQAILQTTRKKWLKSNNINPKKQQVIYITQILSHPIDIRANSSFLILK